MVLSVSEKKKEEVINQVIQHNRGLRFISCCLRLAIPVALLITVVYAALHFLVPDLGVVIVAGAAQKDVVSIVARSILIIVFGVIGHYCTGIFLANRTSKDLTERTDENLVIEGNVLRYSFRTRYHSAADNCVIILIPFDEIKSVVFDKNTGKIEFKGRISSTLVDRYDPTRTYHPNSGNLDALVIYDYFDPSLYEGLCAYGLIR